AVGGERLEQGLLREIRLPRGELLLIAELTLEDVALGPGREVGAGRHRDAARHPRGDARDDDDPAVLRRDGHAAQQADRAEQPVLDAEDEFARADATLERF